MKMIPYSLMIIFVALVVVFAFSNSLNTDVKRAELDEHLAVYRLFNSPDCLGYDNGVINFNKLYNENLEKCFNLPTQEKTGVELKLYDLEGVEVSAAEVNTLLVSQKVTCGLKSSNIDCYSTRKYVLFNQDNQIKQGMLDILVVTYVK
nr:hypothetical protein [Nanoarchaeum sp.]